MSVTVCHRTRLCADAPTAAVAPQGIVVFKIEGEDWTLDLREGKGTLTKGAPEGDADLTLTIGDENFAKLVMGKLGPQQVGCRAA